MKEDNNSSTSTENTNKTTEKVENRELSKKKIGIIIVITIVIFLVIVLVVKGLMKGEKPKKNNDSEVSDTEKIAVEKIELDQDELAILPTDEIILVATITPDDATNKKIKWKSSDESVAVVDSEGKVSAKSIGSTTITATTEDGEFTASCRVVVSEDVVKVRELNLSKSSLTLGIDAYEKIDTEIIPTNATNKGIMWKSEDESIAIVSSSGLITGKKEGTTTITATTKDGNFEKSVRVTVKKIELENIELPEKEVVELGKSKTLEYKLLPKNAPSEDLVWKSSDVSIATVDSKGKVTGKKEGKTTITVMTKDEKVKSKCTVTVSKPVAVTGIKFSTKILTLQEGETKSLGVSVIPNNAVNNTYRWNKDNTDTSIADVIDGKVTGKKVGETTISVKSDEGEFTDTCKILVNPNPTYYKVIFKKDNDEYTLKSVTRKGSEVSFKNVEYNGSTLNIGDKISDTSSKSATVIIDSKTKLSGVQISIE